MELADANIDTPRKLFEKLIELYPQMRPHLLDADGGLRQDAPIFVNGRNLRLTEAGIDIRFKPEDVSSLISPIASGKMNAEALREPAFGRQE